MSTPQLSSFEVMRLVKELQVLEGAFLQKVYQPMEGLLVFKFNTKIGKRFLVHNIGKWLYLTDEFDMDLEPNTGVKGTELPFFVKLLRKQIPNAYVTNTRQMGFDRVIEIYLRKDLPFVLHFEMFGVGNVILTKQGTIVGAQRTHVWRHRTIRAGVEYRAPPQRKDPRSIELSELAILLGKSDSDLVRTLATSVNLGGTYSEEICYRSQLEKSLKANSLEQDQITRIRNAIMEITREVVEGRGGLIHNVDGVRKIAAAIRLKKFGDQEVETFPEMGLAIKAFYPLVEPDDASMAQAASLIERVKNQETMQTEALEGFRKGVAESTAKAEALYLNYQEVEAFIEKVSILRDKEGWTETMKAFPELEVDPANSTISMEVKGKEGEPLKLRLDIRRNINENAQAYYQKAKQLKDKIEGATHALKETRDQIKRLEAARDANVLEVAAATEDRKKSRRIKRKRFWFEANRWALSKAGNLILGGRDAQSNRKMVKKYLKPGDRFVHADIHGAPSIIVKASDHTGNTKEISEDTLQEACHYAVCFSKAWSARIGSGEAYWVLPEQVSTRPESGEFLPKGGFIVRGKRNTIRNLTLELGIGVIELDGGEIVMCAPIECLSARIDKFFKIVPSKAKKSDMAKRLAKELDVSVEEIESVLPPGGSELVD